MSHERTHFDLYTGIGGFSLAARANGVRTVAQCEIEEWLAAGLERTWGVPVHRDVRKLNGADYRGVWLLTAGTPCQPASRTGKRKGASDSRWLWPETLRVLAESEPDWALFENPPGILDVGLDGIVAEMERVGYEVGITRIPAAAVNSPQDRDRVWILGHRSVAGEPVDDTDKIGLRARTIDCGVQEERRMANSFCGPIENSLWSDFQWVSSPERKHGTTVIRRAPSDLYELAHGVSARIPRKFRAKMIAALGNSIVWPIGAEIIKAMIQSEYHPL